MEFTFKVVSRRWRHADTYRLTATETGWDLRHKAHSGPCKPDGSPHLIGNFHQDYIRYPDGVGGFLGFVWEKLQTGEIDAERAQTMIQEVADWVTKCELAQPEWPEWNVSGIHR